MPLTIHPPSGTKVVAEKKARKVIFELHGRDFREYKKKKNLKKSVNSYGFRLSSSLCFEKKS